MNENKLVKIVRAKTVQKNRDVFASQKRRKELGTMRLPMAKVRAGVRVVRKWTDLDVTERRGHDECESVWHAALFDQARRDESGELVICFASL